MTTGTDPGDAPRFETGAEPSDELCGPIAAAPPGRPFVVAQLGQSLDGRIATSTGDSRWINREAALDHLHRLRAHVDAVVVGVGTVVADDPMLNVRRVAGRHPARVVIDPRGRAPATAKCFADDGTARFVVRASKMPPPPGVETILVAPVGDRIAPRDVVVALFARGLRRILIEGGATTVSAFIDAGMVDRLHVLVSPLILGSGKTGLSLAPISKVAQALRPQTRVHVLPDGDVVFDCDLRNSA